MRGMVPRRAGLTIRYSDQEEVTRQTRVAGACPTDLDLYADLERIFFKACQRRTGVRFMRVWFRDLSSPSPQLSLFLSAPQDREKIEKVTRALDCIRGRSGDGAIEYGRTAQGAGRKERQRLDSAVKPQNDRLRQGTRC